MTACMEAWFPLQQSARVRQRRRQEADPQAPGTIPASLLAEERPPEPAGAVIQCRPSRKPAPAPQIPERPQPMRDSRATAHAPSRPASRERLPAWAARHARRRSVSAAEGSFLAGRRVAGRLPVRDLR